MKTKTPFTKQSDLKPVWHIIDAEGKSLGRLATKVASLLIGKHKVNYVTNLVVGDFVVVINAKDIKVPQRTSEQKTYYRHSGYPGGLTATSYTAMLQTKPERVVELAVKNMLPHSKLGAKLFTRLKVYAGAHHDHAAQTPITTVI